MRTRRPLCLPASVHVHVHALVLVLLLENLAAAAPPPATGPDDDPSWPAEWIPVAARAGEPGAAGVTVALHGLFTTLGLYRSDSDFDPTGRTWDRDGQSEGQVATFLRPDLRLEALGGLTVFYQVELGWNAWSLNDPDRWFPGDESYPVLKHREIWAEWAFSDRTRLRTGYQHVTDPSGLFLNHWGGAVLVDLGWGPDRSHTTVVAGQLPDDTLEGVDVRENNFVHDNVFLGVANRWDILPELAFDAAGYFLGDFRAVDRPLYLGAGVLGVRYHGDGGPVLDEAWAWVHVLGQLGEWQGAAIDGGDVTIVSWAAQLGGRLRVGDWTFTLNGFALSDDDRHDGNDRLAAFLGSAKNHSRTLYLTEDEFRDRYDNLDERIATTWGPFFLHRAGLMVWDASVAWRVADWYRPALVLGAAMALNPGNALDKTWIGLEVDLVNTFPLADGVALFAIGQVFVPGEAAAIHVNDVDRTATRPVGGVEVGFTARF